MIANRSQGAGDARIPSLDGWRGIAILLVLFSHLCGTAGFPLDRPAASPLAGLGVRIFFVLSGFLAATSSLALSRPGAFLLRRAVRLLPAAALLVAVMAVAAAWGGVGLGVRDFRSVITGTANYQPRLGWELAHLWSLCVQVHFYLLWALLARRLGAARVPAFAAAAILLLPLARVVIVLASPGWGLLMGSTLESTLDAFACGMLLASQRLRMAAHPVWSRLIASPALVLFLPLVLLSCNGIASTNWKAWLVLLTPLNLMSALLIGRSILVQDRFSRLLAWRPLVLLGTISYSLYLWQQPFLNRYSASWWTAFPLNLAAATVIATICYRMVEQPCARLSHRLGRPAPQAASAAAQPQEERSRAAAAAAAGA